jgi:hypothetical protein
MITSLLLAAALLGAGPKAKIHLDFSTPVEAGARALAIRRIYGTTDKAVYYRMARAMDAIDEGRGVLMQGIIDNVENPRVGPTYAVGAEQLNGLIAARLVFEISRDTPVLVLERDKEACKVAVMGKSAWVRRKDIALPAEPSIAKPKKGRRR